MAEYGSRAALMALSDEDLIRIVSNGHVGRNWALAAKVKLADLQRGMPRAIRSVRAAIMRDPSEFAHLLSEGWQYLVDPAGDDAPESVDSDDVSLRAAAAGMSLGPRGARALFCALAENSQIGDSGFIRERLDELLEIAENAPQPTAGTYVETLCGTTGLIGASRERVTVGDESWPDTDELAAEEDNDPAAYYEDEDGAPTDAAGDDGEPAGEAPSGQGALGQTALDDLRNDADRLHGEAQELVGVLHAAADAIGQGRPADAIGDAVDKWSNAVQALLDSAPKAGLEQPANLRVFLEQISALAAQRSEQESRLRKNALLAMKMVGLLQDEGREEMIAETIAPFGFSCLQELEEAAGIEPTESRPDAPVKPVGKGDSANMGVEAGDAEVDEDESTPAEQAVEPEQAAAGEEEEPEEQAEEPEPPAPIIEAPTEQPSARSETPAPPAEPDPAPAGKKKAPTKPKPVQPADNAAEDTTIPVAEPQVKSEDSLGEWPWDEGDPPIIGQLLLDGREALAYRLASAAAEIPPRRQLLLFACAAAHCAPAAIELSLLPSDADIRAFDTNESLLLLAASLRAGLRMGYAPLGLQSLLDSADSALTDSALKDVLHAAATAVQRGHGRRQPPSGPSAEEMASRWTELGTEAAQTLDKLRQKVLKFQRGSKVLRYLVRDGQPLADALASAATLTSQGVSSASSSEWAQIEEMAEQLRDQSRRDRHLLAAESAVTTAQQRQRPIDGPVKVQLDEMLRDAGDLLSRLLTVRRAILTAGDLKDIAVSDDLERALSQAPNEPPVHSVGDAAIANFLQWLRADDVDPAAQSVQEVLDAALLELFEISRDEQGRPLRAPTASEIAVLLAPREADLVVSGYLDKGDVAAARHFIATRGLEGAGYDDKIAQATKAAKATFEKSRGEAEEGAARLRALYKDDLARDLSERIRQIGDLPRDDRFDLAIEGLRAITAAAETALVAERETLKERVGALTCDESSKARVLERIDDGDEPLAVYFLSLLETGRPLPEVEAPSGDDFSAFVPRIVEIASEAQAAGKDALAAAREALQANSAPPRLLREGLAAWQTLKTRRRGGDDFKRSLGTVLRMVGLTPRPQDWYRGEVSRTTGGGYATIRVAATPVDRSYVPQFGSQAHGSYDVTLVWDRVTPSRLMDFIGEGNRTRPNIVIYFGVLSLADRRHLRTLTRTTAGGKGFSPIVIDEAVIGWLSHLAEPGWRFTQRVTLPFTTVNPYQPNAAGEVPEEVFVGRNDERARIENPTGSMFVYGGRQLGKSALLRRVENLYTDLRAAQAGAVVGKAAVYIDLKAAGIGEAQEPAALWPLLGERLHKAGIIATKSAPSSAHDVTTEIMNWLHSEESNQLLLLLDEADNFLTADSNAGEGDVGRFPVLNALKAVMEESRRRFKAVFAGLHQVQRFFDASNTPVAHGGDAIPIGPLRTHDASDLVVSPMSALGYRFENHELVWRLLLVTNYQASLVQIVCDALVRHLQKRQIPEGGGRMVITADDVRDVCSEQKVRELIAQRFRWTINLDSRYRVIALVVALNSIGADPGIQFTVDDLREECEVWWSDGFNPDELSRNEFERYLVEMQGLGILQQHDADLWALRSPNVIQMLGTPDRLEKELQEAHAHLERPLEYNPTMARQIMGDSEGIASPRSPLTDYELTTLLKDTDTAQVVFGSLALGIDRVVEVLQRQAKREDVQAIVVKSLPSPQLARAGAGGKRVHIIVDLSQSKPDGNLAHICREAVARKNVTATVVLGPAWLDSLDTLAGAPVHKLRRWSTAGLRAWYGSPFDSPVDRKRLHRVTSGWPLLVEEVMSDFSNARSLQESLQRLATRLAVPDRAQRTLADSGIDPEIAKAWVKSVPFSTDSADGIDQLPVSVEDITEALGVNGAELLGRLEALDVAVQDGDSWFLDRVILAAAAAVYQGHE
jgi:hypothetical protein